MINAKAVQNMAQEKMTPPPARREWKTWQKILVGKMALIQIGLFVTAWRDLNGRSAEKINGNKKAWRGALFVNTVGPLAYFFKGRKQSEWTEADVPAMNGKIAIITGANSGIGYDTARVLAERGATVIMACRNMHKANEAAHNIRALNPAGTVVAMRLDLADLDSVHQFVDSFQERFEHLDLLINNGGIMIPPFGKTVQGFESQMGTNHLGHFALTARLNDLLAQTPESRVVTVSSIAHRSGRIDFNDLNWQNKPYKAMPAYGQSKLSNLLFTYELQRKYAKANQDTQAVAAHPGYTATNLQGDSPIMRFFNRIVAQSQPMGALPTLYAATAPDVQGGGYYGPSGLGEIRGNPERVESSDRSYSFADAKRLWSLSEELTHTMFQV